MKMITRAFLLSGILALAATGYARAADERISFTMPQLYAEGIAYNPVSNEFLVSSLHYGIVGAVGMDGTYRQWSRSHGEKFMSSFGIKVDAPRGRALVCVSDLGVSANSTAASKHKFAGVAAYDLTTGQLRDFTNLARLLPGDHFANDLTVDQDGNIYVTDSFAPVIYKIDTRNVATVLFNDPRFGGEGIKLNGIVAHPDGFLLAVRMDSGALFRFDLKTMAITEVTLPAPLPGADGLLLDAANDLILVQNEKGLIRRLHSTDGWKTASLTGSTPTPLSFPTTATMAGGKAYVLEAKLPELFDEKAQKSDKFNIVAVQLIDAVAEAKKVEEERAAKGKAEADAVKAKAKTRKPAKKRAFKETVIKQEVVPVVQQEAPVQSNPEPANPEPAQPKAAQAEPAPQELAPKTEPRIEAIPYPIPEGTAPESAPSVPPNLEAPQLNDAMPQLPMPEAPQAQPGNLIPVAPPTPPIPEKY